MAELPASAAEERRMRAELAAEGSRLDGYLVRITDVHRPGADRPVRAAEAGALGGARSHPGGSLTRAR